MIVAFERAQSLDITGPMEVFVTAGRLLPKNDGYAVTIAAQSKSPVTLSSGLAILPQTTLSRAKAPDTLLVAGGLGAYDAAQRLRTPLRRLGASARRLGAVCTGAFILAEAGLLEDRRATTHWASCEHLASQYPQVSVEPDKIYVKDGAVYTSAGVTAGIDLALAMVEEDHGRSLAMMVAKLLVVFLRRPGGQSQFSHALAAQQGDDPGLNALIAWMAEHPHLDLSVSALAKRARMSPRHFARRFVAAYGVTPARFAERLRLEAAQRRLEEGERSLKKLASDCGFASSETMRRAFVKHIGVPPAIYRERFS